MACVCGVGGGVRRTPGSRAADGTCGTGAGKPPCHSAPGAPFTPHPAPQCSAAAQPPPPLPPRPPRPRLAPGPPPRQLPAAPAGAPGPAAAAAAATAPSRHRPQRGRCRCGPHGSAPPMDEPPHGLLGATVPSHGPTRADHSRTGLLLCLLATGSRRRCRPAAPVALPPPPLPPAPSARSPQPAPRASCGTRLRCVGAVAVVVWGSMESLV
jgi:hypothetical protein